MRHERASRRILVVAAALALAWAASGCQRAPADALGALEYDRVALPAPASERIAEIAVREGERVVAGQVVARLEDARTGAVAAAADAETRRQRAVLDELQSGPRAERIAQARAQLAAARAQARDAQAYSARLEPLGRQRLVAAVEVDRARAAAAQAQAQVRASAAALEELERGARGEELAQGLAALESAAARADAQRVALEELAVVAPRAGIVDSLPYEAGDRPPAGAPLAILLVGEAPHARVYLPAALRARVAVGSAAQVRIDGRDRPLPGRVRAIRSEPVFTPYYALSGEDAARLSWLAEVELTGAEATGLPAGLPVRVAFPGADARGE
ncbi:MAG: HlyD family secretion protein [Gammaproteobacteria bacterium]